MKVELNEEEIKLILIGLRSAEKEGWISTDDEKEMNIVKGIEQKLDRK